MYLLEYDNVVSEFIVLIDICVCDCNTRYLHANFLLQFIQDLKHFSFSLLV